MQHKPTQTCYKHLFTKLYTSDIQ